MRRAAGRHTMPPLVAAGVAIPARPGLAFGEDFSLILRKRRRARVARGKASPLS